MSTFEELLAQDKQLQYALQAVRHYHSEKVPEFLEKDSHNRRPTPSSTPQGSTSTTPASTAGTAANANAQSQLNAGNNKRHIVNVDDISKINYEMIKNTPGNLPDIDEKLDPKSNNSDGEISGLKTKLYKNRLYDLNDDFLEIISHRMPTEEKSSEPPLLPLQDQVNLLSQIQRNLIGDYEDLLNTERKWFILKEILLDANAELDLFSTQEERKKTIKLGATTVPPNANANALVFNRPKRQKAHGSRPDDIL
ncbi:hypothetical protein ZYGR_0S00460 [Zygosaccharomyces rouxii]|uniref:ZYRO0F03476p n=2 Tax=Zygosaccharomyces rouxii TaxID=4956 RepID=C5DXA5_ZYGRC|nr:uncharacterized protein ZYRO0F03476g [Zygosaccharomyces rouxii]KAH9199180.1 hypothetical protein LQ764DRAFT_210337 [Zygosaccharomyces rouxii]GAV49913.1 hypothetical protein ZYGR_0S00460 [Zygosaccharomyces rouxii]CAR28416.1 ZYRO0F03476p [Zygosaccharomyces rouxii]